MAAPHPPAALSRSTGDCAAPEDGPPPAPSSRSSSTDDFCYMFVVELERGPSGLGMGLIDGMVSGRPGPSWGGVEVLVPGAPRSPEAAPLPQHTPLGAPGLYIQTLLPGSPAAADGRLALGDRILEVNGSSLAGVSYPRYAPRPGGRAWQPPQSPAAALSLPALEMRK